MTIKGNLQMTQRDSGFAHVLLIFLGCLLLVVAGTTVALLNRDTSTATPVSEAAYAPTDATVGDSLSADKVDGARLKQFVKTLLSQPVDTTELDNQIATIINNNSDIYI